MTIDALPTAPSPSDDVATFNARAFALFSALATFISQANAQATAVDAAATAASGSATAAGASASAAATSAAAALASAQDAATASGAPLWVSGTTYAAGAAVVAPADLRLYRRLTAGAGTTDPSADGTNWRRADGLSGGTSAEAFFFM